jgi:hypothetical protein
MERDKENTTSLVPVSSTVLAKAGNSIAITNKILAERNIITQYHWDWC